MAQKSSFQIVGSKWGSIARVLGGKPQSFARDWALSLYHLDAQPIEQVSPLIQRQYLHGSQSTFTKWIMKKGAVVPLHHHANEQITWITQGEVEVYSQGRKYVMRAGDIMIIPPDVPHEFWFTQDTIDIDIFSPQRQDWMDGTADYLSKK
jgi:quercetin dioxygenase-like cupin family protein